jgi:hypothetical protein
MAGKILRLKIIAGLAVVVALALVLLAPPYGMLDTASMVEDDFDIVYDLSAVPYQVTEDAFRLAENVFGRGSVLSDEFTRELLDSYLRARDRDAVILFNPGGWGWNTLQSSNSWQSISGGLQDELKKHGYEKPLVLTYRRSIYSFRSYLNEFMAIVGLYPSKGQELAARIDFLTNHLDELQVVVAGESNGAIICDEVMDILRDSERVYSIQTGTPFWHKSAERERTLVINYNGSIPDAFSTGDFFTLISTNIEVLLGFSEHQASSGTILKYFAAPGHSYSWQDPTVRVQITDFLEQNFPVRFSWDY